MIVARDARLSLFPWEGELWLTIRLICVETLGLAHCCEKDYQARALRALGLLLAGGTPTVGGGKTFWAVSQIFLRKQLELRNIKSKNGFQGVMPRAKNGPKTKILGPKKRESLFYSNHVLATTGKSYSKKKSAFAQIIKGGNVILGDFLG